jgi:hypothetical protein
LQPIPGPVQSSTNQADDQVKADVKKEFKDKTLAQLNKAITETVDLQKETEKDPQSFSSEDERMSTLKLEVLRELHGSSSNPGKKG